MRVYCRELTERAMHTRCKKKKFKKKTKREASKREGQNVRLGCVSPPVYKQYCTEPAAAIRCFFFFSQTLQQRQPIMPLISQSDVWSFVPSCSHKAPLTGPHFIRIYRYTKFARESQYCTARDYFSISSCSFFFCCLSFNVSISLLV